jgi:hypothetical protein
MKNFTTTLFHFGTNNNFHTFVHKWEFLIPEKIPLLSHWKEFLKRKKFNLLNSIQLKIIVYFLPNLMRCWAAKSALPEIQQ